MRPQGPWSEKPFAKVFTSPLHRCEGCQFYAQQTHLPAQELQTIPITWPFAVWGLDMVGPLKKGLGGFTRLLVAVDKFTKWIEAKTIINIRSEEAAKFFLKEVFGLL